MHIVSRRIRSDFSEVIGLQVQQVLPIVCAVVASWWTPFDEEKRRLFGNIAGCFVNLKRQVLQLLDRCVWPDDVEESRVVSHETGLIDLLISRLCLA